MIRASAGCRPPPAGPRRSALRQAGHLPRSTRGLHPAADVGHQVGDPHRQERLRLASGAKAEGGLRGAGPGASARSPRQSLLVDAVGLVMHTADRADDVVGRLVVLEDPAQLGRGLAQPLAVLRAGDRCAIMARPAPISGWLRNFFFTPISGTACCRHRRS